jgi:MgtC family
MDVDLIVLQRLAVSFGIGLLLGLQRERAESSIGGIRTFPLIAIFGTVCALLGKAFGGWIVAAGLLGLVAIVVYSNFAKIKSGDIDPGMTTEVAALLLYGLGAYVVIGSMVVTVVVGGAMAVLLQFKKPLHALAGGIGERDMRAIMQFALLSLVILPVLPHQDFGPYDVLESFPNMAHGRAHRWHRPHCLYRLKVPWRPKGYIVGRCSRRSYFQHGDDGELRAPDRGEH